MMTALVLALTLAVAPPKVRPYSINDQVLLRRMSNLKVSPDGTRAVFQLRTTDLDADRGRSDVWLVTLDGGGLKQLTSHPENDVDPTWAPDGKSVFFVSTRLGAAQVWRLPLDGGEPQQVTQSPVGVESFVLSRDGSQLAFAADTFPECEGLECTKRRLDEQAKVKAIGRTYDALFVRHWDSWKDGRRSHLFVQPVSGGPAVDTMPRFAGDAPSKPFGGSDEYTFAPDGRALVFTARDVGREEAWSTNLDLFVVPTDGRKLPVKLTASNLATDTAPLFSPDGKTLSWLAMSRPGYEADKLRVMVCGWPTGPARSLTDNWDRSVSQARWSSDGNSLFVTAQDVGQQGIFSIDVATGAVTKVYSQGNAKDVGVAGTNLVFSLDTIRSPADVYSLPLARGAAPKALTQLNAEHLASVKLGEAEQFAFKGWNDELVHAYVVKPVEFDATKKYPLAFLIHGGPQGSFANDWHYRWNPQVYAGHGYVAVMVDFHGSTGYGQGFTDAIRGDWGGKPLEDLQKGLAAALQRYPFIDRRRVCALGASYGGYMVNWIAGVWSEPFQCLVTHDGNLDEQAAYFQTEELWFPEWEHEGTPWQNPDAYQKHNPVRHVGSWKVPMLVVHGGRDYRVVDTAGLATFTALQRRGVPSKFLYFPDENHWVVKPANSVQWHQTVLGWLDQWTGRR